MTYSEIKNYCKKGKTGMIPGWEGYLSWNYALDQLQFKNKNYIISQEELDKQINKRTDLFYII